MSRHESLSIEVSRVSGEPRLSTWAQGRYFEEGVGVSRLLVASMLAVLAIGSSMPDRAEARGPAATALGTADGLDIFELAQLPEPRSRTEYGELRASRRRPACHWERNYETGTSAWVCRTKEGYGAYPRYPRVVPRYQERRRP